MESIEKLREWLDYKVNRFLTHTIVLNTGAHPDELYEIADEIEAEIAERYMLLPVDADGVPIRCGDKIHRTTSAVDNVVKVIGVSEREFFFNGPNFMEPGIKKNVCNAVRHVPRTIEDVLADFASKQHGITTEENDALIAECAAEIRELMEVDA